jgi:hypothetical protein
MEVGPFIRRRLLSSALDQTNRCDSGMGSIELSSSEVFRRTIQTTGDDFKARDDFDQATEFDRAAERAARLSVIRIADRHGPNYELFHDVASFP